MFVRAKKLKRTGFVCMGMIAVCAVFLKLQAENENIQKSIGGFGYYQADQIFNEENPNGMHHQFFHRAAVRLSLNARLYERLKIKLALEAATWLHNEPQNRRPVYGFFIRDVNGIYSIGDIENPFLKLQAGYFRYKYNPYAKHLGEYVFRSGRTWVNTGFDFPAARLLGLHARVIPVKNLAFDVLLHGETQEFPEGDYHLSGVIGYTNTKLFGIGAAGSYHRLIPATPNGERKFEVIDARDGSVYDVEGNAHPMSEDEEFDTLYFNKSLVKIGAWAGFDPKGLFTSDIFGKNDLKIYAEWALLGIENIPYYYEEPLKRMPVSVGFYVPPPISIIMDYFFEFRLLDELVYEMEYYACPYPLDNLEQNDPTPSSKDDWSEGKDDIKWVVRADKTIAPGWTLKGLIGNDHYKFPGTGGFSRGVEALRDGKDWRWVLRIQYDIPNSL